MTVHIAIDNLLKGAASQAVQCLNLMSGVKEDSGLNSIMIDKYVPQELNISEAAVSRIDKLVSEEAGNAISLRIFVADGGYSDFNMVLD